MRDLHWALGELGLVEGAEPRDDADRPAPSRSAPATSRVVDRRTLPLPKMHPSIPRAQKIKVYELVLRHNYAEAHELAAALERRRVSTRRRPKKHRAPVPAEPCFSTWPTRLHRHLQNLIESRPACVCRRCESVFTPIAIVDDAVEIDQRRAKRDAGFCGSCNRDGRTRVTRLRPRPSIAPDRFEEAA